MQNCHFCEYSLSQINLESIEKTSTKTACCNKFFCQYHENDLFYCYNCNNVYCYSVDEDCSGDNIDFCSSCYSTFCRQCFYKLSTLERSYLDGVCKNCYE